MVKCVAMKIFHPILRRVGSEVTKHYNLEDLGIQFLVSRLFWHYVIVEGDFLEFSIKS